MVLGMHRRRPARTGEWHAPGGETRGTSHRVTLTATDAAAGEHHITPTFHLSDGTELAPAYVQLTVV